MLTLSIPWLSKVSTSLRTSCATSILMFLFMLTCWVYLFVTAVLPCFLSKFYYVDGMIQGSKKKVHYSSTEINILFVFDFREFFKLIDKIMLRQKLNQNWWYPYLKWLTYPSSFLPYVTLERRSSIIKREKNSDVRHKKLLTEIYDVDTHSLLILGKRAFFIEG